MAIERTLALIKPDAVSRGLTGQIVARAQAAGLKPVAMRMLSLTTAQARSFYAVHAERPFYEDLVAFMTEGPIVAMVLEADGAIALWRATMGATDPAEAEPGTIRKDLGTSKERNCTHGSDAPETAAVEVAFFFRTSELLG